MPDWDKLYASTQATTSKHGSQSDEAAALALIDAATEEAKKKGSEKEGEGAGEENEAYDPSDPYDTDNEGSDGYTEADRPEALRTGKYAPKVKEERLDAPNEHLALKLEDFAHQLPSGGNNPYRKAAYHNAAREIRRQKYKIKTSEELRKIKGVGDSMVQKLKHLL